MELKWITPNKNSREITITALGKEGFKNYFGIDT